MQKEISLTHLADFLSVAAKLILIKSQALLPLLQFDSEEESDLVELERQLSALQAIKDVVPTLRTFFAQAQPHYARKGMWGHAVQFTPPPQLSANKLHHAFAQILYDIPALDKLEEKIITDIISLEKRIASVQELVSKRAHVAFSEIVQGATDKQEVVVSFLALLELVKQQIIVVRQDALFADIALQANKEYTTHTTKE